jgi:hypothetical protein
MALNNSVRQITIKRKKIFISHSSSSSWPQLHFWLLPILQLAKQIRLHTECGAAAMRPTTNVVITVTQTVPTRQGEKPASSFAVHPHAHVARSVKRK